MKETPAWKEREDVISGSQVDSVREETPVVWTTCHDHPLLFRKCLPILKSAPNLRVIYGIFPCASITRLIPDSSVAGGQRALGGSSTWWRGATLCEQYTSHVTFSRWSTFNDTHLRGSSLMFGVRSGHLHALMCLIWLLTWSKLSESCPRIKQISWSIDIPIIIDAALSRNIHVGYGALVQYGAPVQYGRRLRQLRSTSHQLQPHPTWHQLQPCTRRLCQ